MSRRSAAGLLALAALLGLIVALVEYLRPNGPINYRPGTLAVVASTLLLLLAAAILAALRHPRGLVGLLAAGCLIDVLGTGVAAWILHAWLLLALMLAGLVAWLLMAEDSPWGFAREAPPVRARALPRWGPQRRRAGGAAPQAFTSEGARVMVRKRAS